LEKQPTHSDLMKEIVELKKRLEKLEPKKTEVEVMLDKLKELLPQKEYVPYPYYPYYPTYPHYPWAVITYTSETSTAGATTTGNIC